MTLSKLHLRKDQERRLKAGHLWIYNNEINTTLSPLKHFTPGELVEIISDRGQFLGIGYINPHTLLCARLLTVHRERIEVDFFISRLRDALVKRENLFAQPFYRWVYSESDCLPGLIIDRFNEVIVAQINTAGMERLKDLILAAILHLVPAKTVIWRNDVSYRETEQLPLLVEVVFGESHDEYTIQENGCEFIASLQSGQKTGWFFDHRDNRERMTHYVKDKTVLDVFSYLGAFALPLVKAGAKHVTCIDRSESAISYLQKNAKRNHCEDKIAAYVDDAFEFLQRSASFDVVILDPPAFIKKKKDFAAGLRAYEKINQLALKLLNPGGVLLTASCSMHLSDKDLLNCLRLASVRLKKPISIIEQVHQGRDHPVHPAIPETNYLKGFVALV